MKGIENIRLSTILDEVSRRFGVAVVDIQGDRRDKAFVEARQCYFLVAREITDKSYRQIASRAGGRDYKTVSYGVRRARERASADPEYAEHYRACMRCFGRLV